MVAHIGSVGSGQAFLVVFRRNICYMLLAFRRFYIFGKKVIVVRQKNNKNYEKTIVRVFVYLLYVVVSYIYLLLFIFFVVFYLFWAGYTLTC